MDIRPGDKDRAGNIFGKDYSLILSDPLFENKLKNFDENLKLVFDQVKKKWSILEWAPDNSGWNIILVLEDDEGNPKPMGDWVFNKLWVFRERYYNKKKIGIDNWFKQLKKEADNQFKKEEDKLSLMSRDKLMDDVVSWRKAAREIDGLPVSDVTAGYKKNKQSTPVKTGFKRVNMEI